MEKCIRHGLHLLFGAGECRPQPTPHFAGCFSHSTATEPTVALQGLDCAAPSIPALQGLLTSVANAAAYGSVVCGCLPPGLDKRAAENLLAEFSMLGTVAGWREIAVELGAGSRVAAAATSPDAGVGGTAIGAAGAEDADGGREQGWLFCAQHRAMSLLQMGIYDDHVAAAQVRYSCNSDSCHACQHSGDLSGTAQCVGHAAGDRPKKHACPVEKACSAPKLRKYVQCPSAD